VPPTEAAYQRGVKYLLTRQKEDGSLHPRSRAPKIQPYFETGFRIRTRSVDLVDGDRLGDRGAGACRRVSGEKVG
jgi:hypothetical protein